MSSSEDRVPVGVLIDTLYYSLNHRIVQRLGEAGFPGVRPAHAKVFENLARADRVSELAEVAQISKQSMAELVEYLEECGYLRRVRDPRDGRAKIVRLTPRGQELVAAAEAILDEIYAEWSELLGGERFAELHEALATLAAAEQAR